MARQTCICALQLLVLVAGFVLTGCGSPPAASPRTDPVHYHIFCLEGTGAQGVTCDPGERQAHYNAFIKEARPQSTFTIWQIGTERSRSRRFFSVCTPDRWGKQVMKAKADFIQKAREGAGGRTAKSEPAGCPPPGAAQGTTKLVVFPDASPIATDVWQAISAGSPASGPAPAVLNSALVCDKSDSTQGVSCTTPVLLGLFDKWITESLLVPQSSLSVEMVGPLRDALHPFYQLTVPQLPLGQLVAHVLAARSEFSRLFAGPQQQYGSTIAEAISAAVRRLRERRRGAYRLIILSDMQQITPGIWAFEKSLPPPQNFIWWLKYTGLAPDLKGVQVLVCGVPTGHFGQNSASYGSRLADLWRQVFQAMGAAPGDTKWFSSCEAALTS